jgi:Papain family cysteine protease
MRYCCLFICLVLSLVARCQQHATGLVLDDAHYDAAPRLAAGGKANATKPAVSLRDHTPIPGNQGVCGSCVGWASAYACLTTLWAIKNNITDKDVITARAYSPMYLFSHISPNCTGSRVEDALRFLEMNGDCLFKTYPYIDYTSYADDFMKEEALKFRIKNYVSLYGTNAKDSVKIEETKMSIENNQPVIIGSMLYESFNNVGANNASWHPDMVHEATIGAHALCVVGYNDFSRQFEILNSWGTNWGKDGYFFISYDDYVKVARYAFQITIDDRTSPADPIGIHGDFEVDRFDYVDNNTHTPVFAEILPKLNANEYELTSGMKQGGYVRMIAKNIKKDFFVYVFSIDPAGKPTVLYPYGKSDFAQDHHVDTATNEIPKTYEGDVFEIPGNEKAIQTDVAGHDHICILYAYKPIGDIVAVAQKVATDPAGDYLARLKNALAGRLMPATSLHYSATSMSVSASSTQGDIIPIILNINVEQ